MTRFAPLTPEAAARELVARIAAEAPNADEIVELIGEIIDPLLEAEHVRALHAERALEGAILSRPNPLDMILGDGSREIVIRRVDR